MLSTATPAIGAWLVPIDQLKSTLQKLDMEATLRVCAVMGCIMTEALEVKKHNLELISIHICSSFIWHIKVVSLCAFVITEEEHSHSIPEQV